MKKLSIVAFLITLFVGIASAEVPPVIPNTYVQDHANVLTPEDEANIQNQLNQLKIKYNLEFAVATVTTTEPRVIADYSLEMARTYGIGAKDGEKRGILLLLAIKDRKWRFEISRHMEAVLTDGQSGSIGRNVLVPALKKAKDSTGYRDAILLTLSATEQQFVKNIEPEQQAPIVGTSDSGGGGGTALVVLGTLGGLGALGGGGYGLFAWRRRRREEEEERLAKEKAEREAHEAWLKTPEGIAETKRLAKLAAERVERERQARIERERLARIEAERYAKWAASPEGKAELARRAEAERKRQAEAKARREREEREEEERRARRRREESYSSSYSSGSSSSSSGFGGGGDFSGGGSDGSW